MDVVSIFFGSLSLVLLILVWGIRSELRSFRRDVRRLNASLQSRQGQITTITRGHSSTPPIDARARTTRRDTADLPLTGRQSRMKTARRGGDLLDSVNNDDRLSDSFGPPAT